MSLSKGQELLCICECGYVLFRHKHSMRSLLLLLSFLSLGFLLLGFILFLSGDDCSVDQEESVHSGLEDQDSVEVGRVGQLPQTVGEGGTQVGQGELVRQALKTLG